MNLHNIIVVNCLQPDFFAILYTSFISFKLANPVEIITGFPILQIFLTKELSFISNDDTLYKLVLSFFKSSTPSSSNGVLKHGIFYFLA